MTTAAEIVKALGGHSIGRGSYMTHCPVHKDDTPSLSIKQGAGGIVLFYCHAGCEYNDIVNALRARGVLNGRGKISKKVVVMRENDSERTEKALEIWRESRPAIGTLVETYLRARGISLPLPDSIRFHPKLRHSSGETCPGMVALVTSSIDNVPVAVHRTFLARDGRSKAKVSPSKMMLGPCRGGVVRLGDLVPKLLIAEGIETALAGMAIFKRAAWAALSTSGLKRLDLPTSVKEVHILADNDEPGKQAAAEAQARWAAGGVIVRIQIPFTGKDFNDRLGAHHERLRQGAE